MTDRAAAALLWLATLAFVAHRALAPMAETDLFFHLALGERILADHAIPFRNLYSFTYPSHPDPDLAWGFQVLVALLQRLGGFAAIVIGKTALIVAAAALAHRAARRDGAGPLAAALAIVLALVAADQRLVERPHLITFVGIGALQGLLVSAEQGRPRRLWLVLPLVVVWANLHAGVFLAPLILAADASGRWLERTILRREIGQPSPRCVFAMAGLAAAATFATPAGTRLPAYLLWHTGLGATRIIEEFRRADPWDDPWFFVLLTAVALTLLVEGRRVRLRRLVPLLVVGALAWRSVRFVAEWSFLAAPFVAVGASRLARALGLEEGAGDPISPARPRVALAVAAAGLVVAVGAQRIGRPLRVGLAGDVVPFAAIDFVTRAGLRERLYHDLDVGCYLLWEGWPRFRVFQDARLPAYPDEFHRALDETSLAPARFDALLRRYSVDAALIAEPGINMRSGSFDPEEWALVWRRPDALVYARRTDGHARLIAEREIPLRVRFDFARGAHVEPIPQPPPRSPVPPCAWHRRLADALDAEADPERALDARERALGAGCFDPVEEAAVRFRLGARLQLRGQAEAAAREYDRVVSIAATGGPAAQRGQVDALVNRAYARLRSRPEEARADFAAALALDPDRRDARHGLALLPPPSPP